MCMLVSVTGLVTSMTSQTPELFDNLPLVAVSRGVTRHLSPSSLRPCRFDYNVEIAYGELGRSLAQARRARVNSELGTPLVAPSHMPVLDLSRAFTYSSHSFFSHRNTQRPSRVWVGGLTWTVTHD